MSRRREVGEVLNAIPEDGSDTSKRNPANKMLRAAPSSGLGSNGIKKRLIDYWAAAQDVAATGFMPYAWIVMVR